MGSLIATHIAHEHPNLVKKLILYEPPVFASETGHKRYERRKSAYLRAFGYIASRQELVLMYSQVLGQRLKGNTAFSMDRAGWLPFERSLRNTVIHQNTYDELLTIQTPTDIVYGRKDRLVIRVGANQLFASNPNISIHTIKEIHGLTPRSAKYLRDLINQRVYKK
jgi:pimeloyl-ACP methyl ester carboxylesterase